MPPRFGLLFSLALVSMLALPSECMNPNKRDKDKQREQGGEHMKKHGTAKERARKRNRARAAKKRANETIG